MTGILAPAVFAMHLATCAQQYPLVLQAPLTAQRHLAHASVESKLNPNAIHDNGAANGHGKGDVYTPETAAEAVRIARQLLSEGHRIDAGVMQVTDHNWAAYGLTVETVFDPARNICAGARILGQALRAELAGALDRAACRYNAGRPDCGPYYPDLVQKAELRLQAAPEPAQVVPAAAPSPPPCAPTWARWALASCLSKPQPKPESGK